jgi:hypothetical protein
MEGLLLPGDAVEFVDELPGRRGGGRGRAVAGSIPLLFGHVHSGVQGLLRVYSNT